jgi:hypothetical protein
LDLPFTQDQFFDFLAHYNSSLGLLPALTVLAGVALAAMFFWLEPIRNAWIVWLLDVVWLINAAAYFLGAYSQIDPYAPLYAALFFAQAVGLGAVAVTAHNDLFPPRDRVHYGFALVCVVYSLILYPLWIIAGGQAYPAVPLFGIAPSPTTIFTVGILAMMRSPLREWLMVVPLLWCFVGGLAAITLGLAADYALWVAGAAAFVLLIRERLGLL